ncbi:TadE/TadG family type IV pilus assembly protein [Devosia sp. SL43]|uniref:TadE/TadG family type IV pilus assembly protein n=1 Tax=Devosia sp. SL43 TaxID=2806348 RepID=UPI001F1D2820|nr:TadE/TadG family type IV pilus assembly protein [Devosia sp. SL43]UJW86951.1 pilus assembly protein [Devosia sp. SL43]
MNHSRLKALLGDNKGVSAVEFALIVPVILILLIGMVDLNEALTIHRKLRQVTSTIADLTAQQSELTASTVALTLQGAASLLAPYDRSSLQLVLTVISIDDNAQTVAWSMAYQAVAEEAGATPLFPAPEDLALAGVQMVAVRADYEFTTVFGALTKVFSGREGYAMSDQMYERPRTSDEIVLQ